MKARNARMMFLAGSLMVIGLIAAGPVVMGATTVTTYIGPASPADWATPAYWDNGVPVTTVTPAGPAWSVVITNAVDFTGAINVPTALVGISTGSGLVQFPAGMNLNAGTGFTPAASLTVGSGGVSFGGGLNSSFGGNPTISIGGNLTATGLSWGNDGSVLQTGGLISIASFNFPIGGALVNINALAFAAGFPSTISAGGTPSANYRFMGTPTFGGGWRPDWSLTSGYDTGANGIWNLNGYTLLGDDVYVTAGGSPASRYAVLSNSVAGGTVDANRLVIGYNGYTNAHVTIANGSVIIRGSGTAYDNQSTRATQFNLTANTTTTFDPTGGALSVDTGSKDRGGDGLQASDWDNNFAFGNVVIGTGDTITLVGNANIEGGGDNALYVAGTLSGAGTIAGGRNVYVQGGVSPGGSPGILSVVGSLYLLSNAVASIELNGLTLGSGYDAIDVDGSVVISNAVLDLSLGFSPPELSTFTILDNDGSDPVGGYFVAPDSTPLTEGTMWIDGGRFSISYLGGDGNDIVLTSFIPEPSVALLLALGAGLLARRRGKRIS